MVFWNKNVPWINELMGNTHYIKQHPLVLQAPLWYHSTWPMLYSFRDCLHPRLAVHLPELFSLYFQRSSSILSDLGGPYIPLPPDMAACDTTIFVPLWMLWGERKISSIFLFRTATGQKFTDLINIFCVFENFFLHIKFHFITIRTSNMGYIILINF